jgi:hypothetical protein
MVGRQMAAAVLDQVQVLDQEIASARALAQERAHLRKRPRVDLTAFRGAPRPPATAGRLANCATI